MSSHKLVTILMHRSGYQAARGTKKSKIHTPFLPNFARQTKGALKQKAAIASSSKHTLDDDAEKPAKRARVKRVVESIIPRESSRKSAVTFKETVQGRLKEIAIKRVSRLRLSSVDFWLIRIVGDHNETTSSESRRLAHAGRPDRRSTGDGGDQSSIAARLLRRRGGSERS